MVAREKEEVFIVQSVMEQTEGPSLRARAPGSRYTTLGSVLSRTPEEGEKF